MLGKRVLIDIQAWRIVDGQKYRDQNFTGVVVAITAGGVAVRRDDTGAIEEVAAQPDEFEVADSDPYVLRSTGMVVPQPDYTIRLTHLDEARGWGFGIGRDVSP